MKTIKYGCCNRPAAISTATSGITPINGIIYWHLDESSISTDLEKYKILFTLENAFSQWQEYFIPTFESTNDADKAAIVFRFKVNGDRDLPFEFEDGVLAYAFFPDGKSLDYTSDIYVNDFYNWQLAHTDQGYSLFKVIVHEIGHALGLDHSSIEQDIMYPSYIPDNNVFISQDTIEGIYKLYGTPEKSCPDLIDGKIELLSSVFKSARDLSKLKETQLVEIAKSIGISASVSDLKLNTINKILKRIS